MMKQNRLNKFILTLVLSSFCLVSPGLAATLDEIRAAGKLRHLGIIYANFVTKDQGGLDSELMQKFAQHLGVEYQFVASDWSNIVTDLTGKKVKPSGDQVSIIEEQLPIRGDVIATGFTVLPWRSKIVDFSSMTFPSGIWLLARADSKLKPIVPTGDVDKDMRLVKDSLAGVGVLGLENSCLDPHLYDLEKTGAKIELFPADRNLEEMIPSVVARLAETTLMDVPVALMALESWPGEIKVIGPVSTDQSMAVAFAKGSLQLRQAFEEFFSAFKASGDYRKLVEKYYPSLFTYYPTFLAE
jgi:ABC-type amino acid transport substrate-binding protein